MHVCLIQVYTCTCRSHVHAVIFCMKTYILLHLVHLVVYNAKSLSIQRLYAYTYSKGTKMLRW